MSIGKSATCAIAVLGLSLTACDPVEDAPSSEQAHPAREAASPGARSVLSADGARIAFTVSGRGDTALVFIHGWACDADYWAPQVPLFARSHAVVTVDLAGHGKSDLNRRTWTMEAFGEDVAAVVRALPQERIILIGHSMGGYAALEAARLFPDRVIAVVGVDSLQDVDGRPGDPEGARSFLEDLKARPRDTTRAFVRQTFFTVRSDPDLVHRIVEDMASAPPAVTIPAMEALVAYEPAPVAGALDIPVVAIHGDMMPVDQSAAQRRVARFRSIHLEGAGHFLQLEAPTRFNAILAEEIRRIENASARLPPPP